MYQTAEKFDGEIKFGSLAVGVETAKLKFANIIFAKTHNVNDVILLGPAPLTVHVASSAHTVKQVCKLMVLFKYLKAREATLPDKWTCPSLTKRSD